MYHRKILNSRGGERIRTGFARWPAAYRHYPEVDDFHQHPFFGGFDEGDDPFTPIVINDSGCTVCSGITMDEALYNPDSPSPVRRPMLREIVDETESSQDDLEVPVGPALTQKPPSIRHTQPASSPFMTMPHNVQGDLGGTSSASAKDQSSSAPDIHEIEQESKDLDAEMDDLGWGEIEDVKPHFTSFRTDSTAESSEEEVDEEQNHDGDFQDQDEGFPVNLARSSGVDTTSRFKRTVSIRLEDFDTDHLTIFKDSIFDGNINDEDSCDEEEASIVRKLENNASELYWLQLTTALTDAARLAQAMQGNTAVRNVTVYPSAIENLSYVEQKAVVDAICQLRSLKNLIVFQDCGSLFVDPLIRYRPPLTRLTLYKLDVSGDSLFSKLVMLLVGLHGLEELSLEKYKGGSGCRLLKVVAKVLPSMKSLKSLSMTPSRGVKLTSEGPHALFRALRKNNTIRTLSLQGSADCIDQEAITELADALRVNATLEDVKLTGFWKSEDAFWKRFTEETTLRINYFLGLNKAGIRNLQMDVNTDFETLKNVIVAQKDNLGHVFYLLSQNPSIVNPT